MNKYTRRQREVPNMVARNWGLLSNWYAQYNDKWSKTRRKRRDNHKREENRYVNHFCNKMVSKISRRRIADRIISTRPQGKVVHLPQSPSGLLQRQWSHTTSDQDPKYPWSRVISRSSFHRSFVSNLDRMDLPTVIQVRNCLESMGETAGSPHSNMPRFLELS